MAFEIKPNRRESENKTIRFPLEVIEKINDAITGKDVSFSNLCAQKISVGFIFLTNYSYRVIILL